MYFNEMIVTKTQAQADLERKIMEKSGRKKLLSALALDGFTAVTPQVSPKLLG